MSRLYQFVLRKEGFKSSFEDFLIQAPNGLSKNIHKGWLSVKKDKGDLYGMYFTATHPLKLKVGLNVLAYVEFPNNVVDRIFFCVKQNMKQTIFKRRKDNVLFYLWFSTTTSTKAEFRTSIYDDLDTERYAMDEIIRNHNEFEFIDGEQGINHCWTARNGNEIVRVNNYGELIHNPKVEVDKSYTLSSAPNGRKYKIVSIGSWDEDAKAYRLIYYGGKNHEGCGLDTDFNV